MVSIPLPPHELHEVDPVMKYEEKVHLQEPHFLAGSLMMDEQTIQEALKALHGIHVLVSKIYWNMEETSSMEDMEKIQKAISNTKGNISSLLSDINYLLELVEMYHGVT